MFIELLAVFITLYQTSEEIEQAAGSQRDLLVLSLYLNEQISEIFWYIDDQLQQTGSRFDTSFTVTILLQVANTK